MADRRIVVCDVCRFEEATSRELGNPEGKWGALSLPYAVTYIDPIHGQVTTTAGYQSICPTCLAFVVAILKLREVPSAARSLSRSAVETANGRNEMAIADVVTKSTLVTSAAPAARSKALRALRGAQQALGETTLALARARRELADVEARRA